MIITKENATYVQKYDLKFLRNIYRILPEDIDQKIFNNPDIDPDDYNIFDFFKFTDPKDIEYFSNLECLNDYTYIKELSKEEFQEMVKNVVRRLDEITKKLYNTDKNDPEYSSIFLQYKSLNYKVVDLRHIAEYKNGFIDMNLPKEHKLKIPKLMQRIFSPKTSKN